MVGKELLVAFDQVAALWRNELRLVLLELFLGSFQNLRVLLFPIVVKQSTDFRNFSRFWDLFLFQRRIFFVFKREGFNWCLFTEPLQEGGSRLFGKLVSGS